MLDQFANKIRIYDKDCRIVHVNNLDLRRGNNYNIISSQFKLKMKHLEVNS